MKRKVILHDKITNKTVDGEQEVRALDHLEAQRKYRANIFRNRKLYTRKVKHKKNQNEN